MSQTALFSGAACDGNQGQWKLRMPRKYKCKLKHIEAPFGKHSECRACFVYKLITIFSFIIFLITPNHLSSQSRMSEKAFLAISNGADISRALSELEVSERAETLILFTQLGDLDAVTRLLSAGVDPNAQSTGGALALHAAVAAEDAELVELLLEAGANPERSSNGLSAVDLARTSPNRKIRKLVLGEAVPDSLLLEEAAAQNDVGKLRELLADVPENSDTMLVTPLVVAAMAGAKEAANELILAGAEVNGRTSDGLNPLGAAILSGARSTVEQLLAAGASPNAKIGGMPMLSVAVVADEESIVRSLIEAGADLEQETNDGALPAAIALGLGREALVDKLQQSPAQVRESASEKREFDCFVFNDQRFCE